VDVTVKAPTGKPQPAIWKVLGPDEIAVSLPTNEDRHEQLMVSIEGPQGTDPATLMVAPPTKAPPPAARIIALFSEPPVPDSVTSPAILLDAANEIPSSARLSFTLKAEPGAHFTGHEAVEVGTTGSETTAHLTLGNGLTLVDPTVMVVNLTPSQALGSSAYGPMRFRLTRGDAAGDWRGVGIVVRLPRLKAIDCPADPSGKCTLRGEALYLLASVSATRDFDSATSVPEGYPGTTLSIVRPNQDGLLFVRLHDAPEVLNHLEIKMTRKLVS
jgi:hypothetical protein